MIPVAMDHGLPQERVPGVLLRPGSHPDHGVESVVIFKGECAAWLANFFIGI